VGTDGDAQGRDLRRSIGFVMDTPVSGRRFRIMTLVDDFTRECLDGNGHLTRRPKIRREIDCIGRLRGYPKMLVSDNGTEFTSNAILGWQQEHDVEWHYIAPGNALDGVRLKPRRSQSPYRLQRYCATLGHRSCGRSLPAFRLG
jgi:transposase InsO family protein